MLVTSSALQVRRRAVALFAFVLATAGCAGPVKNMRELPAGEALQPPATDRARIVFMRPSGYGAGVQASVFEVVDGGPRLVGIVAARKKVALDVAPGQHLFMAVGESADFMSADVRAGRTYHALVTPRMGAWKARFSLRPVTAGELGGGQFESWAGACSWVETTADSTRWAESNRASIQAKLDKYLPDWRSKPPDKQPALRPEDGR